MTPNQTKALAALLTCKSRTEAARACIAHAAKLGIPELVAFTFVGNGRSRRVMQKLGMTCVGEFDHPALPEGHPLRRHALYRIRTEQ